MSKLAIAEGAQSRGQIESTVSSLIGQLDSRLLPAGTSSVIVENNLKDALSYPVRGLFLDLEGTMRPLLGSEIRAPRELWRRIEVLKEEGIDIAFCSGQSMRTLRASIRTYLRSKGNQIFYYAACGSSHSGPYEKANYEYVFSREDERAVSIILRELGLEPFGTVHPKKDARVQAIHFAPGRSLLQALKRRDPKFVRKLLGQKGMEPNDEETAVLALAGRESENYKARYLYSLALRSAAYRLVQGALKERKLKIPIGITGEYGLAFSARDKDFALRHFIELLGAFGRDRILAAADQHLWGRGVDGCILNAREKVTAVSVGFLDTAPLTVGGGPVGLNCLLSAATFRGRDRKSFHFK